MNRIVGVELETLERTIAVLESAAMRLINSEHGEAALVAARVLRMSVEQSDDDLLAWAARHALLALECGQTERAMRILRQALRTPEPVA